MSNIWLDIAGFKIALINRTDTEIRLEEGYRQFQAPQFSKPSAVVRVHRLNELDDFGIGQMIYQAVLDNQPLWKIYRMADGFGFQVYNPLEPGTLLHRATLSSDMKEWNIYSSTENDTICPLEYPMGPLVMYYLTVTNRAVMIHGSGIAEDGLARVFTGVSGKGKSTMARLWHEAGAEVLNDDRLIIRIEDEEPVVYNTPMFYEDRPRNSKLGAIHVIYHEKENVVRSLSGAEAVSNVMSNIIQHGYDQRIVQHHLDFVTELIEKIEVCSTGFLPDHSVVNLIRQKNGNPCVQ